MAASFRACKGASLEAITTSRFGPLFEVCPRPLLGKATTLSALMPQDRDPTASVAAPVEHSRDRNGLTLPSAWRTNAMAATLASSACCKVYLSLIVQAAGEMPHGAGVACRCGRGASAMRCPNAVNNSLRSSSMCQVPSIKLTL